MPGRKTEAHALADALDEYVKLHGLAKWRVGVYLFKGCRCGIAKLRQTKRPTDAVVARVRAFLASDPPPGLHRRPLGGPRKRRDRSTGAWLAEKIEALIVEHNLSARRVTLHLFNSPHGLKRLREKKPHAKTVARVLARLEKLDIAALRDPPPRVRRVLRPIPPYVARFPRPAPRRRALTFEEQLKRVLEGKARVVEKIALPSREPDYTLAGVSDWGGF